MFAGVFIPTGVLKLNPCLEKEEKRKTDVFISSTIEFICLVQRFRCRLQQVMKCQWCCARTVKPGPRWAAERSSRSKTQHMFSLWVVFAVTLTAHLLQSLPHRQLNGAPGAPVERRVNGALAREANQAICHPFTHSSSYKCWIILLFTRAADKTTQEPLTQQNRLSKPAAFNRTVFTLQEGKICKHASACVRAHIHTNIHALHVIKCVSACD